MINKVIVVAVALLFLGVAVAPGIIAQMPKDDGGIEITVEACGVTGFQPQTVKLTAQQAREIEQVFDSLKTRLDSIKTREEAIPLFQDAIIQLNAYGLLPDGLSIEQIQNLVIVGHRNHHTPLVREESVGNAQDESSYLLDFFGLIAGKSTGTYFETLASIVKRIIVSPFLIPAGMVAVFIVLLYIASVFRGGPGPLLEMLVNFIDRCAVLVGKWLCFSPSWKTLYGGANIWYFNSSGWVSSVGALFGLHFQSINGTLIGELPILGVSRLYQEYLKLLSSQSHSPGIGAMGFTGLRFHNRQSDESFYIGSALIVHVSEGE